MVLWGFMKYFLSLSHWLLNTKHPYYHSRFEGNVWLKPQDKPYLLVQQCVVAQEEAVKVIILKEIQFFAV